MSIDIKTSRAICCNGAETSTELLLAFRASLGAWMESYEDEAQSFIAINGLAPHVHAFHRGRVKAMKDLLSFLEDAGGEG